MQVQIRLKNKIIGKIDEERKIYISERNSDHFFRIFNGFGMSVCILNHLRAINIETIIILYERRVYKASVQLFYEKGIPHRNELDLNDAQLILPLNYFKRRGENETL